MLQCNTKQNFTAELTAEQVEAALRAYVAQDHDMPVPADAEVEVRSAYKRAKGAAVSWTVETPADSVVRQNVPGGEGTGEALDVDLSEASDEEMPY
jgi:hypothetical protein